jgi:hypothetical protein
VKSSGLFAVCLIALAFAAPALGDQTFNDDPNEDPDSADISTVAVSNDPVAGTIVFTVTTPNMPTFEDNASFTVFIDADQNAATGDPYGYDAVVSGTNAGSVLNKWNGSSFDVAGSVPASFANAAYTVTINAADLGNPPMFDFTVESVRGSDPDNLFYDDTDTFTYELVQPPPPTVSSAAATFIGVPTHGRAFRVTALQLNLSSGASTPAAAFGCTAHLGIRTLQGRGIGHCTFLLPKTAKGKKLVLKVHGTYLTTTVAKTYSFKVK